MQHSQRIPDHGQVTDGKEALGLLGGDVAKPATAAGCQNHGLKLVRNHFDANRVINFNDPKSYVRKVSKAEIAVCLF